MRLPIRNIRRLRYRMMLLFFSILLINIPVLVSAQESNGSKPDPGFIALIIANGAQEEQVRVDTLDPQLNLTLTIRPFVVKEVDGQTHFSELALDSGIIKANQYFSNIGIRFHADPVKSIPEYEYGIITNKDSTAEMEVKYARKDYINLFLVESIVMNESYYYGYTFFPNDTLHSAIFLRKKYASGNYLTSLLGNFFGLLNTHERLGGIERVDGSNCKEAGDFICDTWADPGLSGTVGDDCLYTITSIDPQGDFYVPSVANLMSDSNDMCKCVFSMQQYRRMIYYYLNYRKNLR